MPDLTQQIRAFRWKRQELGAVRKASTAEVIEHTGWMRSVGGAGPYLGLFARAGISREDVDADVAALKIHELPAARGCTYVVPAADFALALRAGQGFASDYHVARKHLGVTETEIEKLCEGIERELSRAPLDPAQLKDALGGAVRNLGEAGKKRGVTTTLPVALGLMQSWGEIRRVPVNGRLDQQRYRYARWSLRIPKWTDEEVAIELARRYFRWAAPATAAQFQWWAGLGARAAKAAVAELKPIVRGMFGKATAGIDQALKRTEAFIREQLGDARSFSLDSPESRAPRIAALRRI